MKKKMWLLLLIIFLGFSLPKEVDAVIVYNNSILDIDYRINNDENRTDLKYKLYDLKGTINIESTFDSINNQYVLKVNTSNVRESFVNFIPNITSRLDLLETRETFFGEDQYEQIFQDDELIKFSKCETGLNGYSVDGWICTAYGTLPLVLDKYQGNTLLDKKIVFASVHNSLHWKLRSTMIYDETFALSLFNNNVEEHCFHPGCDHPINSNNNPDNIDFMTNTIYDYSDGLWEALNSSKIASSEVNDFVRSYTASNNDSNKNGSVTKIINPKTFTNGVYILAFILITIAGCTTLILKKRK